MMRHDAQSMRRLAAMGIQVWQRREAVQLDQGPGEAADSRVEPEPGLGDSAGVRVRLASGDGEWLLVQRQPWRGQHEKLLADIRAILGAERCRFGQWSAESAAGESATELNERGVRYILSFGPPPGSLDWPGLLIAPTLDELVAEADAKRSLWQLLAPRLGH